MKRLLGIAIIAILVAASASAQKTVEGFVEYKYLVKGEGSEQMVGMMPDKMISVFGKNGVSIEMKGGMMGGMMGKIVVDGTSGEMFMIKELEQAVYIMNQDELEEMAGETPEAEVTELDGTKEILGYKCKKFVQKTMTQGMEVSQTIWATSKLKYHEYDKDIFSNMMGQDVVNFQIEGFPLLMITEIPGTEMTIELEVTDIKFKNIKDSEFKKPVGYEEKPFTSLGIGM